MQPQENKAAAAPKPFFRCLPRFSLQSSVLAMLLCGSGIYVISDWSPWKVKAVLTAHTGVVAAARCSYDGLSILTASTSMIPTGSNTLSPVNDHDLLIWDLSTGGVMQRLLGDSGYWADAAFSHRDTMVAACGEDRICLWHLSHGQARALMDPDRHIKDISAIVFWPDDTVLLAVGGKRTLLWDTVSGRYLGSLDGHKKQISQAAYLPDGIRVVTASTDKTCRLWSVPDCRVITELDDLPSALRSVAVSPEGQQIAVGDEDGNVYLWNPPTGRPRLTMKASGEVTCLEFSRGVHPWLISAGGKHVTIWDPKDGLQISNLVGHEDVVTKATFSHDGLLVLTASQDRTARIWDTTTGANLAILYPPKHPFGVSSFSICSAEFTKDDRGVILTHDTRVSLWEKTRVEQWWGILGTLPACLALAFAVALAVSLLRDRNRLRYTRTANGM